MKLADHPTVRRIRLKTVTAPSRRSRSRSMRHGCGNCASTAGPTTSGLVEIGRPALDDQRDDILRAFPPHQDAHQLRLPHEPGADPQPGPLGRQPRIPPHRRSRQRGRPQGRGRTLEGRGIRAMNPAMGFPMEMDRFPGKIWVVSHKPVAVAAGLGHDGHPPQRHPPRSSATSSCWAPS